MSKEVLYWAENAAGRIYFTDPAADLQPGYMLKSTNKSREMDKLFKKMHQQERDHNEKMIEKLHSRGKEYNEILRSQLRTRMNSSGVSNIEKEIIRESLRLMDERDAKLQQNNVYGVSALQEAPEPLPAPRTRVM